MATVTHALVHVQHKSSAVAEAGICTAKQAACSLGACLVSVQLFEVVLDLLHYKAHCF